jgi:RNA polymerase sigma factor (sigma-70 family)
VAITDDYAGCTDFVTGIVAWQYGVPLLNGNVTNWTFVTNQRGAGIVNLEQREAQWSAWMRAALAGDDAAYRALLEALSAPLRSTARHRLARAGSGDRDVEDIVQETLLAIHLKRHTWRSAEPIGPWIAAIARNKFVDVLRRRGRHAELPIDGVLEESLVADVEESDAGIDLGRMLSVLGERQKEIVRLVSIEGHSARDTAQRLGMTEGALRVALHRSLRALALHLKSQAR